MPVRSTPANPWRRVVRMGLSMRTRVENWPALELVCWHSLIALAETLDTRTHGALNRVGHRYLLATEMAKFIYDKRTESQSAPVVESKTDVVDLRSGEIRGPSLGIN